MGIQALLHHALHGLEGNGQLPVLRLLHDELVMTAAMTEEDQHAVNTQDQQQRQGDDQPDPDAWIGQEPAGPGRYILTEKQLRGQRGTARQHQ